MLARVKYIHSKGLIHRDIKPDNFMTGLGSNSNQVYVIDFCLARRWRDPRTDQHIRFREGKNLTGIARYSSINTHLGYEQSRRDDIEALGYCLVYLLNDTLPWMNQQAPNQRKKNELVAQVKIATPVDASPRVHTFFERSTTAQLSGLSPIRRISHNVQGAVHPRELHLRRRVGLGQELGYNLHTRSSNVTAHEEARQGIREDRWKASRWPATRHTTWKASPHEGRNEPKEGSQPPPDQTRLAEMTPAAEALRHTRKTIMAWIEKTDWFDPMSVQVTDMMDSFIRKLQEAAFS
jgi:serine/threonine protein kinase